MTGRDRDDLGICEVHWASIFCNSLAYLQSLFRPSRKLDAFPLELMTPLANTKELPPMFLCCHIRLGNDLGSYRQFLKRWHNDIKSMVQFKWALHTTLVIFMVEWVATGIVNVFISVLVTWLIIVFHVCFRYPAIVFLGPMQPTHQDFFPFVTYASL